jgi:VanZ family protein
LTVFSTLLILAGTLTPSDKLWDSTLWSYDKIGHAGLFFGWAWNVRAWFNRYGEIPSAALKTCLYSAIFGALIEFLQFLLPINRQADFFDFLADVTGALVALFLYYFVRKV